LLDSALPKASWYRFDSFGDGYWAQMILQAAGRLFQTNELCEKHNARLDDPSASDIRGKADHVQKVPIPASLKTSSRNPNSIWTDCLGGNLLRLTLSVGHIKQ